MRSKTKKQLQNWFIYFLIFLFAITTLLLFLPVSQPAPVSTAPPLNTIPDQGQQQVPPEVQQQLQEQIRQQKSGQSNPNPAPAQ